MHVKNPSKKTAIAKNAKICESIFSKFLGLMFSKNTKKTLIFIFKDETRVSLHMLFVFYPIDVLFLSKEKVVVDLKENFKPFSFYTSKEKSAYTLELPKGSIKKSKTAIGDKIYF